MSKQRVVRLVEYPTQPAAPERPPLLTLEAAAKVLGISPQALNFCLEQGTIQALRIGKREKRVPIAEIDKFRTGEYGHGFGPRVSIPRQEGNDLAGEAGSGRR